MSRRRIRVAVLFGGKSAEHEISIRSAQSILEALDPELFETVPVGIDRSGRWFLAGSVGELTDSNHPVALLAQPGDSAHRLVDISDIAAARDGAPVDVVFPVLHGPLGEDGTVQGVLELAGLPYVGSGVLGSAVGMDKDVAKRLLRDAGIAVAPFVVFRRSETAIGSYEAVRAQLGERLFVKPANLGSSVGVSRVRSADEYRTAVESAFRFDTKVIVEREITGREIECSVLGNDAPIASVPGEIRPADAFYSYRAKYLDEHGAELLIPAEVDAETADRIRSVSIETFRALSLEGMARVDMFLEPGGRIVVNEVNTIPGFTSISMYPKLWEATGLRYRDLVTKLIELAIERHERRSTLSTRYDALDDP